MPTDAYLQMNALLTRVLLDIARRRQDDLPGLAESLQDRVLIMSGGTTRRAAGWFRAEAWQDGKRSIHELFLNAAFGDHDPRISAEEDVLVTLLHEACHVFADANDIRDTSRGKRYHNRCFAETALQIGLEVEKDQEIGHRTPRLSDRGQRDYGDLLSELRDGLTLVRTPRLAQPDQDQLDGQPSDDADGDDRPANTTQKYFFASCTCRAGRGRVTIRVARGSWREGFIWCKACGSAFEESLTARRQRGR